VTLRAVAFVLAGAILFAACDAPSPQKATPSAFPEAMEVTPAGSSPAPSATPARTAVPPRLPTSAPIGPLAVYSTELTWDHRGDRTWPTREVRAFDTGAGKDWASFAYGGFEDYPVGDDLASGRLVVYATENRVFIRSLEGGSPRLLFEAPKATTVNGLAVSRLGTLLAVTTGPLDFNDFTLSELVILDIATGTDGPSPARAVRTFQRSDAVFNGLCGWLAYPDWLAGDVGLMVIGAIPKDGPGCRATVFMDGRVTVNKPAWRLLSSDGRFAFVSGGSPCYGAGADVSIVDAASDETLREVHSGSGGLVAIEWAPDSSAVLYMSFDDSAAACRSEQNVAWWLLPVHGAAPQSVPDVAVLRRQWSGPVLFELTCPDDPVPHVAPADRGYASCNAYPSVGKLTIGGVPAREGRAIRTLGTIQ
jgi:hypothetical protein